MVTNSLKHILVNVKGLLELEPCGLIQAVSPGKRRDSRFQAGRESYRFVQCWCHVGVLSFAREGPSFDTAHTGHRAIQKHVLSRATSNARLADGSLWRIPCLSFADGQEVVIAANKCEQFRPGYGLAFVMKPYETIQVPRSPLMARNDFTKAYQVPNASVSPQYH